MMYLEQFSENQGESENNLDPFNLRDPVSAYLFLSDDAQEEIQNPLSHKLKCLCVNMNSWEEKLTITRCVMGLYSKRDSKDLPAGECPLFRESTFNAYQSHHH